jgi:hypothetical protein
MIVTFLRLYQYLRLVTFTANEWYKILSGDQGRQCRVKNQRFGD